MPGATSATSNVSEASTPRFYSWSELALIPKKPGVYAWYYIVDVPQYDVDKTVTDVERAYESGDQGEAENLVAAFLSKFVFDPFAETPYVATVRGPLKPKYGGELRHEPEPSGDLVSRIAAQPERLRSLHQVLRASVPNFASPIYIGMASNLNDRIGTHKRLIGQYREGKGGSGNDRDHSFARRVVQRDLKLHGLRVCAEVIESAGDEHLDAENVLNRINYPILGRN